MAPEVVSAAQEASSGTTGVLNLEVEFAISVTQLSVSAPSQPLFPVGMGHTGGFVGAPWAWLLPTGLAMCVGRFVHMPLTVLCWLFPEKLFGRAQGLLQAGGLFLAVLREALCWDQKTAFLCRCRHLSTHPSRPLWQRVGIPSTRAMPSHCVSLEAPLWDLGPLY